MCGKQSIDDDSGQTGQIVAGLMGWGAATQASKVSFGEGGVSVEKEVDGGTGMLLSLYLCLEFNANWLQKRSDHNSQWL
jgi:electron transfer flavoprotein alpha/beta subunit